MAAPAIYRRRKRRDTANAWVGRPLKKFSGRCDQGGDLAAEIILRPVDAVAQRVAHESRHLDRTAGLALGFLDRLRNTLVRLMDVGLIEQTDFLEEGLES